MSFTGTIEAKCPGCSETEEFEIWSFVRGDLDETLRERVKGGELNVLECAHCGRLFYPEASWVYADAVRELVAFVFPESYEAQADVWRRKMKEDYERMRPVAVKLGLLEEPVVLFGPYRLAEILQRSDDLEDEAEVGRYFFEKLGLRSRLVRAAFAREHDFPRRLPYAPSAGQYTREGAVAGLKKLIEANDRLEGYRRWLEYLEGDGPQPPFREGDR